MSRNEEDEFLEQLILNGAVEVVGLDLETNEPLYTFTDKLAQFSPALHQNMSNYFYKEMMFLWENGFIEMDITEKNPTVRLTEKALDETKTRSLEKDQWYSLKEIIRLMSSDE
jgi:hypothetical protein